MIFPLKPNGMRKKPESCISIDEIRDAIDSLDYEIISLFAERFRYVKEIVKFKHDEVGIIAEERKEQVINQRINWAEESGLDPEVFETIYRTLINSNIKKELELLNSKAFEYKRI